MEGSGGERRRDKSVSFSKSPAGKEWRVSQRSIKPRREKARTGELRAATSEFYWLWQPGRPLRRTLVVLYVRLKEIWIASRNSLLVLLFLLAAELLYNIIYIGRWKVPFFRKLPVYYLSVRPGDLPPRKTNLPLPECRRFYRTYFIYCLLYGPFLRYLKEITLEGCSV